jgi:hypothetical protein
MDHRLRALDADPERQRKRHVNAPQLLQGQAERERIGVAAAELLAEAHPWQAEVAQPAIQAVVEARLAVSLLGARRDLRADQVAHRALHLKLDVRVPIRVHTAAPPPGPLYR